MGVSLMKQTANVNSTANVRHLVFGLSNSCSLETHNFTGLLGSDYILLTASSMYLERLRLLNSRTDASLCCSVIVLYKYSSYIIASSHVCLCLSVCPSVVCLSVHLSVCLSVCCLSVCLLSVCLLSVCLSVCCLSLCLLSVCLAVSLSLSLCLSVSLSVCCLSVRLSVCLSSVCLSVI